MSQVASIIELRPSLNSSYGRWASLGPYYAMFPVDFAFEVVAKHLSQGDSVLDPFAGRASSVFAAAALHRSGVGIEINPVGWLYGRVKLRPAPKEHVLDRLEEIGRIGSRSKTPRVGNLAEFFNVCYSEPVLKFLCAARRNLDWQHNAADATLAALLLVYLHGKCPFSLSNQMRQSKAMSPRYAIRWWRERRMIPPEMDPVDFLRKRIDWRYAKGRHRAPGSMVYLGDSVSVLDTLCRLHRPPQFGLLFTSPPYFNVTNYHYDQWLRLWFLNFQPSSDNEWRRKFASRGSYKRLLREVFSKSARLLKPSATIYVRTDAREFTLTTTKDVLKSIFPGKRMSVVQRPFGKATQTALYGDANNKPGDVDIILK